jgi:hypothetical protein
LTQVRSLTLDVKVWDPPVLNLFKSLGNVYANSIWEELLHSKSSFQADELHTRLVMHNFFFEEKVTDSNAQLDLTETDLFLC